MECYVVLVLFWILYMIFSINCISDALDSKQSSYSKRGTDPSLYAPIRIKTVFSDLESELGNAEIQNLKKILNKAVLYIQNTFTVLPVTGPLLLKRSGCRSVWSRGPNRNKCSMVKRNYRGEKCLNFFKIPSEHLEQLAVWKVNGSEPHRVLYPAGTGAQDADFVLYVQSLNTARCQLHTNQTIVAYASYCQLGQNDRPIAGYINICPEELQILHNNEEKLFLMSLHELFHTFGFSKDLFSKFRDCTNPDRCQIRSSLFRRINGVQRLITPAVVRESKKHFHCLTESEFGVPLQLTKNGHVTSHWNPKFMQGSIMAPNLDMPHLTSVDQMSLAVFEDSGWYQVNYSMADPYLWGKGEGCSFGLAETCNKRGDFFCTGRSQGCHYLHMDKAECNTNHFLGDCHIFLASSDGACTNINGVDVDIDDAGQVYSPQSRCFLSNLTLQNHTVEAAGRCYRHQCLNEQELQVNIGSGWQLCPAGLSIEIPGYSGRVACPTRPEFICMKRLNNHILSDVEEVTTVSNLPKVLKKDVLPVYIIFDQSDHGVRTAEMGNIVVSKVLSLANISQHQVKNILVDGGSVSFELHIQHNETSPAFVFNTLLTAVKNRSFIVVSSSGQVLTAVDIRQRKKPDMKSSKQKKSPVVPVALAIGFSILVPLTLVMTVVFIRKKLQCSGADERRLDKSSYEDIEMNNEVP